MAKENMEFVVDAHVHCGKGYSFKDYSKEIKETPIKGAVVFSLASDIYQREIKSFEDNNKWKEKRRNANKSVLSLAKKTKIKVYPFKFVWNDFDREDFERYFGVKWHRRNVDAEYKIGSPKFIKLVVRIREMNVPIVFEDEFVNTMKFLNKWAKGINVIIPHFGFGSRTYDELKKAGVWEKKNVYTDTSYASSCLINIIEKHIIGYGHERILFGSDYPLCSKPQEELEKILSLDISDEAKRAITSKNILRLMDGVRKTKKPAN